MKRIFSFLLLIFSVLHGFSAAPDSAASQSVLVGMTDTAAYFPLLRGRRVAVLANHTAVAEMPDGNAATAVAEMPDGSIAAAVAEMPGTNLPTDAAGRVHLVDLLHARGFHLTGIFSPEHGFRGGADAGERVGDATDERTGIPIRSLYDGNARRPSDAAMHSFDVLVVDMQDVGLRFYTYYISMLRLMDACADFDRQVVVLDRPNPHGEKVDGPVLDMRYKSGVGALPLPVLHGLTMGEIARMAVGEGWVRKCDLTVVKCRNYTHATEYLLPVPPSPNLPTQRAVYLYPSLCLFEGTVLSVGRGTDRPFEIYGHPKLRGCAFSFTPRPSAGAKHPLFEGERCFGYDLSSIPLSEARTMGLTLEYLVDAYRRMDMGEAFFKPVFEKLIGVGYVREMIRKGASAAEIEARWQEDVRRFMELRARYLLYPDRSALCPR